MRYRLSGSMISPRRCGRSLPAAPSLRCRSSLDVGAGSGGRAVLRPLRTLKTPWANSDLQGIWTVETDTPVPALAQECEPGEFFTEAERAEFDQRGGRSCSRLRRSCAARQLRSTSPAPTTRSGAVASAPAHVVGAAGRPRSMACIPGLTPEAQKVACKARSRSSCRLDPDAGETQTSKPRAAQVCGRQVRPDAWPGRAAQRVPGSLQHRAHEPLRQSRGRMRSPDRCLTIGLPEFLGAGNGGGSFRRIVQTLGRHRHRLRRSARPRLAAQHRDERQPASAGRASASGSAICAATWEGNTLVIDVTNFVARKDDYHGARGENLHLVERWTRTSPTTLEYVVTMDDPDCAGAALDRQAGVHPAERSRKTGFTTQPRRGVEETWASRR